MQTEDIDPELPWGHWLAIRTSGRERVYVDEATGEQWRTLRSALWHGRLGMPPNDGREPPPEHIELIHAVLAARARRPRILEAEEAGDLFHGSVLFRSHHLEWLAGHGLIVGRTVANDARLSDEGRSVLLMLHSTRPHSTRGSRPSGATVQQLEGLGAGCEEREVRLARVERISSTWDAAFMRREAEDRLSVVLETRREGPERTAAWELAVNTRGQRDNLYEWLCFRMDRWPAWAGMATADGSDALTRKLLATMAAALQPHVPHSPPKMRENWD